MRHLFLVISLCVSCASCYEAEDIGLDGGDGGDGSQAFADIRLSSYSSHYCKINEANEVLCWGKNENGQLGDGTTEFRIVPVKVEGITATDISVGLNHTCAVMLSGQVFCWGRSNYGQAGVAAQETVTTPTRIEGLVDIVQVASGAYYNCALDKSGQVFCFGMAKDETGPGYSDTVVGQTGPTPVEMPAIADIVILRAGGHTTCGVNLNQEAICWGAPPIMEDPAVESNNWQSRVVLTDVKDLSIGNGYFCYINTSGILWCGGNSTKYKADLKPVLDQTVVEVSAKSSNGPACALTGQGEVYCVEDPINPDKPQFVGFEKVDEMPQAVSIATGNEIVCAILSTGETTCVTIGLSVSSSL